MICRISGRIERVGTDSAVIDVGPVSYEVLVPRSSIGDLQRLKGEPVSLFTMQYIDGAAVGGQMTPRMLGFLSQSDRDFFLEFIKVKNVGLRKALRAMSVPSGHIAGAIESGDESALSRLPEIGKRTAAQIIAQLRGKLERFLVSAPAPAPVAELNEAQRLALEMLVKWGERPGDAQRWLTQAGKKHPGLEEPDALVKAAYRIKQGV